MNDFEFDTIIQKIASYSTYMLSGGVFLGEVMDWLNNNAAGVMTLLAGATYLTNVYFQVRRRRDAIRARAIEQALIKDQVEAGLRNGTEH